MEPRLTVSVQTVLRSTVGAAGFSRDTPIATPTKTKLPAINHTICRRRFCCLNSGRAISIDGEYALVRPRDGNRYPLEIPRPRGSKRILANGPLSAHQIECP